MDDEWLTADEQLTHFSKARERILSRIKVSELPYIQGPQSSEEELVVRERFTSIAYSPSVREPVTNGNDAPVGQLQKNGSSDNSQEMPV